MSPHLIVVGWSARAAVQSARRAGFSADAVDAYLDADLQQTARTCVRLTSWRRAAEAAAQLPPSEWLYVGGLENHPDVVGEISRRHRLLGTGSAALRRVRDPVELQRSVRRGGFSFPAMRPAETAAAVDPAEQWLVKRRGSAGGVGVAWFDRMRPVAADAYLQQFIDGTSYGATYVAAGGKALYLGACRLLSTGDAVTGNAATNDASPPFGYAGSIGPMDFAPTVTAKLARLGDVLVADFAPSGLVGVDFILDADDEPWPLEVNPRYTASVELLERATGASLLSIHRKACLEGLLPPMATLPAASRLHGKRIVYHRGTASLTVREDQAAAWLRQAVGGDHYAQLADVPVAGTQIAPGEPIATIFAAGRTEQDVLRRLDEHEARLLL